MKPRTVEEYLAICQWVEERQAPKRHSAWKPECDVIGWKMLDDYAHQLAEEKHSEASVRTERPQRTPDETQLHHVRSCRFCRVRFLTFAEGYGLTREAALERLERDYGKAVEATRTKQERDAQQPAAAQPPREPRPIPAAGAFAVQLRSRDAEVGAPAQERHFKWQRDTGTVSGRLRFVPRGEGMLEPQIRLDPPPPAPITLTLWFGDDAASVPLKVGEEGWSEACAPVPARSLQRGALVPPDGKIVMQP